MDLASIDVVQSPGVYSITTYSLWMCVAMSSQHKFCRVLFIGWWAPLSLSPQFGRWEPTEHRYWQQNVTAVFCYFCHRKCLTIFRYSNEKTYQINGIQCERWEFNTQHAVTMQMEYQIVVTALLCSGVVPVAQINTSAFVLVLVLCCFATQSLCYLFDRRSIDFFSRIKHGEKSIEIPPKTGVFRHSALHDQMGIPRPS